MFLNLNISFCSLSTNIWTIIKFKCIFYKPLRSLNRRFRRHFVFKGKKWHIFFLPFINEVILKCLPKMCPLTSRTPDAHVTFGKLRPPRVLIWRKMARWCPINMTESLASGSYHRSYNQADNYDPYLRLLAGGDLTHLHTHWLRGSEVGISQNNMAVAVRATRTRPFRFMAGWLVRFRKTSCPCLIRPPSPILTSSPIAVITTTAAWGFFF